MKARTIVIILFVVALAAGAFFWLTREHARQPIAQLFGPNPDLRKERAGLLPTMHVAKAVGWKAGETPTAAAGLQVKAFATGLAHPRWLLTLPNGDVLVAETNAPPKPDDGKGIKGWVQGLVMGHAGANAPSANRITLLRDTNGDGVADVRSVLIGGLNSPFGMALVGTTLYVADTDAVLRFPLTPGQTKITAPGVKVVDLPAGPINHHWTKNVVANADGSRLFVTVGSNSNVAENGLAAEQGRAAIWEVDPKTGGHRIYASGIRNPNGMAWEPNTNMLWAVANERDELGSDLVPDYLTYVEFGANFGWPWFYYGTHVDERAPGRDDDMAQYVRRPDYALGPHTASLGLSFAKGETLGPQFASGAFIGQHGSWNRKPFSGYKVIFVPFTARGQPKGLPVDVLTGFLNKDEQARGRPVGVVLDKSGALLVADDVGNAIWRVSRAAKTASR